MNLRIITHLYITNLLINVTFFYCNGTNHPQLKQSTRVTHVLSACDFRGVGGCLAIHECGCTHVHAHKVLHVSAYCASVT